MIEPDRKTSGAPAALPRHRRRAAPMARFAARCAAAAALLTALVVAVAPAAAQERARLRAGEHAGFSRIALDVPGLEGWDASRNGRILTVLFRDRELLFDTSQIFPGRRVSRVTSARSERGRDGTRLTLSLSCSCDAETYEFQPGMLVIDIRPRSEDAAAEQLDGAGAGDDQASTPGGGDAADQAPGGDGDAGETRARRPASALDIRRDEPAPATSAILLDAPEASGAPPVDAPPAEATQGAGPPPSAASEPDPVTVSDAQRRLLQQLSRAADQGLVEFRSPQARGDVRAQAGSAPAGASDPSPAPAATAEAAAGNAPSEASAAVNPPVASSQAVESGAPEPASRAPAGPGPAPAPLQLDARTAFDAAGPPPSPPAPEPCAAEPFLDPQAWLPGDAPYARLSDLRGRLTTEFDRADPQVALDLARLMVGLGLGLEARQVLEEFVPPIPEAKVLEDLARLSDGDTALPSGPLAAAGDCGGRAGLWRLAAGFPPGAEPLADPEWGDSVLDAFGELPLPLRRRAGPGLVETLVQAGAFDLADQARLRLDRAPGDHGDPWRMALGRLALARGEVEAGDALLATVVDHGGPLAPEAMLDLADSILARSDHLPDQLVEDIALAAFEHQGELLGRRLLVAEILGRAGRHQLGVALDVIETELHAGGARAEDLEAAMRAILERARAEDVGPLDYASAILSHKAMIGGDAAFDPARVKVARELTGIGLANAGLDVLGPALTREGAEARMAAAAADIAVGAPNTALKRLDGLDDADADRLRARALAALNRNDEAFRAVADHLPTTGGERAELAWRGAAWEDAEALPTDDPRKLLARWMATRDGPPSPVPPRGDDGSAAGDAADGDRGAVRTGTGGGESAGGEAARGDAGVAEGAPSPDLFLARPDLDAPPSLAGARAAIERSDRVRNLLQQALGGG